MAQLVAVIAGHGNHGSVVGRELKFGQEGAPAALFALLDDAVSEARVGRHTACNGDIADARILRCAYQLLEQDFDDGRLQRGTQVGLMLLDEVGVLLHGIAQRVEERGLPRKMNYLGEN